MEEVIFINLLFWNLAKNSIENYISDIIEEHDIDIGVFSEYKRNSVESIIAKLNGKYLSYEGMGVCDKIILIAKSHFDIKVRREQSRYIIYSLKSDTEQFIIVGIHLQDNIHSDEYRRKIVIRDLVSDISEQEKILKHSNTIVIGDFNSSPFDNEFIQKDAFNAVLFKELILKTEYVTIDHRKYRRFYNPMLNYISEENLNYGSFYYSNGIKALYWYCYDQVLLRKPLVNKLENVFYCKTIKNKRLLKDIAPNKKISDHLPLIVKIERRSGNV
ncbi:MAG: endonuclease/exonuclease/phosphatase family protein [Ruminococcaceae bacterium]|nr:endonuclease/exonuclease/phosphatase family protein [Oscillospiraceae bacterium]